MDAPGLPPIQPGSPGWYIMSGVLMAATALLMQVYTMVQKARRERLADVRQEQSEGYAQKKDAFATARDELRQSITDLRSDRDRMREDMGKQEAKNEAQAKEITELQGKLARVEGKHEDCERRLAALERSKNRKKRGRA